MSVLEKNEFPPEVIEEIRNYVYRLIDPRNGETFYVGRGVGNRVFQHVNGILPDKELDEVSAKIRTIREIMSAGLQVIHVIHRHGLDENTAKEVEAALIDAYPGATNLAGGYGSNDYGPMNAVEIMDRYAAEEAVFEHNVLMITVNNTHIERDIYDATRFAWKLSLSKVKRVEYVLATVRGVIKEVFIPNEWKKATMENFPEFGLDRPNRLGFTGSTADESIRNLYIRKRIPPKYRQKGAANPVKYNF